MQVDPGDVRELVDLLATERVERQPAHLGDVPRAAATTSATPASVAVAFPAHVLPGHRLRSAQPSTSGAVTTCDRRPCGLGVRAARAFTYMVRSGGSDRTDGHPVRGVAHGCVPLVTDLIDSRCHRPRGHG